MNAHLRDALAKLTDRESPDFRNSIKESISAVEALCCLIIGKKASLGKAIKKLREAGVPLHQSQVKAWGHLYGYTSDQEGIRHALLEMPDIGFSDALYM